MTGYIKLKKGVREDPMIIVSDELGREVKKIKFGDPQNGIGPCESSRLLDFGDSFSGTYGDIANVWFEVDKKERPPDPEPTEEELEKQKVEWQEEKNGKWKQIKEEISKDLDRPVKNFIPTISAEELKKSEEELAEFNNK